MPPFSFQIRRRVIIKPEDGPSAPQERHGGKYHPEVDRFSPVVERTSQRTSARELGRGCKQAADEREPDEISRRTITPAKKPETVRGQHEASRSCEQRDIELDGIVGQRRVRRRLPADEQKRTIPRCRYLRAGSRRVPYRPTRPFALTQRHRRPINSLRSVAMKRQTSRSRCRKTPSSTGTLASPPRTHKALKHPDRAHQSLSGTPETRRPVGQEPADEAPLLRNVKYSC
jgi:hypothetical protein